MGMKFHNYFFYFLLYSLAPQILFSQTENFYEVGKILHETTPGYSSSYLPLKEGPLVNHQYTHETSYLQEPHKLSLAERFDLSRKIYSQLSPQKIEIPLFPFFTHVGHSPTADRWEGKCHQWAAAANDKGINKLLEKVDMSEGLLCGDIIYKPGDIRELITASYFSRNKSFIGERTNKKQLNEELNDLIKKNYFLQDDLPAKIFHETVHKSLKEKQGVVLDMDSGVEVWNHPVHSISSEITLVPEQDIYFLINQPSFFIIPDEAQEHVRDIQNIEKDMKGLLKMNKNDRTLRLKSLFADQIQSDHIKKLVNELENEFPTADIEIDINYLMFKIPEIVNSLYQLAMTKGMKLRPNLTVKGIKTTLKYLTESGYQDGFQLGGGIELQREFRYIIVEKKSESSPLSSVVASYWSDGRPDFIWIPKCETETCDKEAIFYRQLLKDKTISEIQDILKQHQQVSLTIALSDLMNLFASPICQPIKTLEDQLRKLDDLIRIPDEQNTIEEILKLKKVYLQMKETNVPLKKEMVEYFDSIIP
jgi:hypothetical protein